MTKIRMILQCRLSSSRLPGKALLPLGGMPSFVLAARRCANKGGDLVLATSTDSSDDIVAATAADHGIPCFRGSLDHVLQRTVDAVSDMEDRDILVRLTADNSFPDQSLINELTEEIQAQDIDYIDTRWPDNDLPYGVAIEVARVGAWRDAAREATTAFDIENTTPWIRRNRGMDTLVNHAGHGWGSVRATLDTFDDYVNLRAVWDQVDDPVNIPWTRLCEEMAALPHLAKQRVALVSRQGLPGTDPDAWRISRAVINATTTAISFGPDAPDAMMNAMNAGVTHFVVDHHAPGTNSAIAKAVAHGRDSRIGLIFRLPDDVDRPDKAVAAVWQCLAETTMKQLAFVILPPNAPDTVLAAITALQKAGRIGRLGAHAASAETGFADILWGRSGGNDPRISIESPSFPFTPEDGICYCLPLDNKMPVRFTGLMA